MKTTPGVVSRGTKGEMIAVRGVKRRRSLRSRPAATSMAFILALTGASLAGVLGQDTSSSGSGDGGQSGPSISNVSVVPWSAMAPGDAFTTTWTYSNGNPSEPLTTGDLTAFEIHLSSCGESDGSCGCSRTSLIPLCPSVGCMDSDGSYDLTVESSNSTYSIETGTLYQVIVSLASDTSVYSCGPGFRVEEEEDDEPDLDINVGGDDEDSSVSQDGDSATLSITPMTVELTPGQAFTAQWFYDNGQGNAEEEEGIGSPGNFAIDLYSCAAEACSDGSCGTFVAALCEEEGCYDPGTGDYDVVVPDTVEPGVFSLYVEELSEGGPADCASFNVSLESSVPTPAPQQAGDGASSTTAPVTTPSPTVSGTETPNTGMPTTPEPTPSAPITAAPISRSIPSATPAPTTAGEPGTPGVPPTPVPAKQECDPTAVLSFEHSDDEDTGGSLITVAHESGNRTEGACLTMTDVYEWLQSGPTGVSENLLYPIDATSGAAATNQTGAWFLRASLYVTNGVTLEMKGTAAGGDCDELKIRSSSAQMHSMIAHGGNIDIYKTKIQSWKETSAEPHDLGSNSDGSEARSYIACVSEIVNEDDTCGDGAAQKDMGECRMDMEDSELGYLGYYGTEAYGITWKVRGFCKDLSNEDVFDNVNVYGDIKNCDIHHMWYGMYSYGHLGGVWINNLMHDNHVYGFDPHDDSDYLTIHNNTVYDNAYHGIIASKRCDHVSIMNNKVNSSGGSGIMLHRSCDDSEIIGNVVYNSTDAGVALVETSRTIVKDNIFADGKWGARLTLGATDNRIFNNSFARNTQRELYLYPGDDEPWVATSTCVNNTFDSNIVEYVADGPINVEESNSTVFTSNVFSGGEGYFEFDTAIDTRFVGNTGDIIESDEHRLEGGSCFTADSQLEPAC